MDQATRNNVCFLVMQLCLKELFEFSYMQTDPNWANFFYNEETKQVHIIEIIYSIVIVNLRMLLLLNNLKTILSRLLK